ncbi:DUF5819 family protein [Streptomyces monashensis]|uniref:Uncharacterized protein n=1 Tax=Streptomyces monashensis TaxID=1678012 RepID=A0A1S2PYD8_9ACTN|nr:DUF5819 family protein [Streptomyces monashensis]OIJ98858.1 hypothetical protein BIV23_29215 [Streptomyces monashensis]
MLLALVPVMLFTAACLVYNAPNSPAKARVARPVNRFMGAYFEQDWQLFGPNPGTSVDLVYVEARIKPAGKNEVVQTQPVEIEDAIDRTPRDFRVNPTKLPGVMLGFNEFATKYIKEKEEVDQLPASRRAQAVKYLASDFAPDFDELQRFLSVRATSLFPNARIISIRATFRSKPITPFASRYESPAPKQKIEGRLQTSWLTYVPGVAD